MWVSVCECVCVSVGVCECVCERERELVCAYVCACGEGENLRERVCVVRVRAWCVRARMLSPQPWSSSWSWSSLPGLCACQHQSICISRGYWRILKTPIRPKNTRVSATHLQPARQHRPSYPPAGYPGVWFRDICGICCGQSWHFQRSTVLAPIRYTRR